MVGLCEWNRLHRGRSHWVHLSHRLPDLAYYIYKHDSIRSSTSGLLHSYTSPYHSSAAILISYYHSHLLVAILTSYYHSYFFLPSSFLLILRRKHGTFTLGLIFLEFRVLRFSVRKIIQTINISRNKARNFYGMTNSIAKRNHGKRTSDRKFVYRGTYRNALAVATRTQIFIFFQ